MSVSVIVILSDRVLGTGSGQQITQEWLGEHQAGGGGGGGGNVMCNLISLSLSLLLSLAWKLIGGAEGIFQLMPARIIIISTYTLVKWSWRGLKYTGISLIINARKEKYPCSNAGWKFFLYLVLIVITLRCLRGNDNDNTYYNTLSGEQGYRLSMTDDDWVELGQHQLW